MNPNKGKKTFNNFIYSQEKDNLKALSKLPPELNKV